MKARDVRNLIMTLIVMAVGVKLLLWLTSRYIAQYSTSFSDLVSAFTGMGDLVIYGAAVLIVLLVPYYFSKRSQEKKVQ